MQGYMTYAGVMAAVIFTVTNQFFTEEEAMSLATALLTLVSLVVTAYGRFRIKKAQY